MLCPSCSAATNAGDRFCANCGSALEQRCGTCGTVLPEDARFCPSCGTATSSAAATDDIDYPGEERKVISVVFTDLVGFTAASDGADPEDVRRRLQPFHTALREVVEGFGGRIEKLMGDGVLAVFGAPIVHEDDAERAVRAGLRIQERVEEMAGVTGMSARVAVGTGEAMVLIEGTTQDQEGLVGDVVNTASRLQGEAEPGTVLVDDATHRATRRAFHYDERAPVAVKGKGAPINVWVALEPVARFGSDIDDVGATLVGRDSELTLLIDAFSRTVGDETSQIVTIAGEPGVGKSRLVRELRRHIDDLPDLIRWRQGRCLSYGEGITYWALGQIVKAEAGIFETDSPGTALGKLGASLEPLLVDGDERTWVAGRLAPLVGSEQEATTEKKERFAAWYRYFASLGEQRPTVVVVEDLHWADSNLVEFLEGVPEATRDIPLLLVCTARPDFFEIHPTWGAGQRNAVTVRLEPLDAIAIEQLLDELLVDEPLDAETRRVIVDRSGGNPLWAQEFVRMLRDRSGEVADLAMPDTVQAVVASRIDLLDATTKTVIQAASTIGKSFWVGAIADLVDDPDGLEDSLRELERRELIRRERVSAMAGEIEYAFTHSVVRDVAYGQTPRVVRAGRHHRVARWIERMAGHRVADRAEVIAHHDAEALRIAVATDISDVTAFAEAAFASHQRAAEQVGRLDLSTQRTHLEAALELVPPGDRRRGSVLFALAEVHVGLGLVDSGRKSLLEAREEFDLAGDLEGWGQASSWLGQNYWASGDPSGAMKIVEETIERLEQHPPGPALAHAYARYAGNLWLRGDAAKVLEVIERVRHVVEVHGDPQTRQRILAAEGGARFDTGDPGAVESFRQVLRMTVEADDSFGMGVAHLNLGEQLRTGWGPHEAIPVHERGLEVAVQRRTSGTEQFLRHSLADGYIVEGRWDEALSQLEAASAVPERLAYLDFVGPRIVIEAGRGEAPDDALEQIERLVADSEGMEDLQKIVPTYGEAMWVHLMIGEETDAVEYARRIVERSGATRYLIDSWSLTLWMLRRAGELSRMGDLLPELSRFDMPRPRALFAIAEALLAEEVDAEGALDAIEQAAADLEGLGVVTEAVIALADAARITDKLGDADRATAIRSRARGLLAGARAETFLERLGV